MSKRPLMSSPSSETDKKQRLDGEIDSLSINTIRCLAADMVQQANSGHPGYVAYAYVYLFIALVCF